MTERLRKTAIEVAIYGHYLKDDTELEVLDPFTFEPVFYGTYAEYKLRPVNVTPGKHEA